MYDETFKILIFGDAGTGKELLTQRFFTNNNFFNNQMK